MDVLHSHCCGLDVHKNSVVACRIIPGPNGQPLKQTVNQLLRAGLQQAAAPVKPRPFRVKPKKVGLPPEWTSGSVPELIEMLEGPAHR